MGKVNNVLVTGGSGLLGSYVVSELKQYYQVAVLDKKVPEDPTVTYIEADIMNLPQMLDVLSGHDALIHLAAIDAAVVASIETVYQINTVGTWNTLYAAHQAGIKKVLLCTSDASLGGEILWGDPPLHYLPVDESHPLYPSTTYALSKQVQEDIAQYFVRRFNMQVHCLRPTLIIYPQMFKAMVDGIIEELAYDNAADLPRYERDTLGFEPLGSTRTYSLAQDVAKSFRLALQLQSGKAFDTYFIAAADSFDPLPTLEHVKKRYGELPEIRAPQLYQNNPRASILDTSKAEYILGWSASCDWITALETYDTQLATTFRSLMTH